MVLIDNKKYACQACIKGHRTSVCRHKDRPLVEIRKKGRPQTQCEHCRELRKTKQVHVKCNCSKSDASSTFSTGSDLETHASSSIHNASSSGTTSGSSSPEPGFGGMSQSCACGRPDDCRCCTPRKKPTKGKSFKARETQEVKPSFESINPDIISPILSRLSELRPAPAQFPYEAGPVHAPSYGTSCSHAHHTVFSPYHQAYDSLPRQDAYDVDNTTGSMLVPPIATNASESNTLRNEKTLTSNTLDPYTTNFPSACTCGPLCACPGCKEHNPMTTGAPDAFASCKDPSSCGACLDCTIMSLPTADSSSLQDIDQATMDEWMRQITDPNWPSTSTDTPPTMTWDFGQNSVMSSGSWNQTQQAGPSLMSERDLFFPDAIRTRSTSSSSHSSYNSYESSAGRQLSDYDLSYVPDSFQYEESHPHSPSSSSSSQSNFASMH